MIKILTWYWKQEPNRAGYDAEKVNRWAAQWRSHLTIPYTLACVTEHPEGIDRDIEIIEPPGDFEDIRIKKWAESSGAPQCYRRLAMFRKDAARLFGAEWFVCSDIDLIIVDDVDDLIDPSIDFRMFGGTSSKRPYNGSMMQIRAGARTQVYDKFASDPEGCASRARGYYIGSDQAVISMILGAGERTWTSDDGVFAYSPRFRRVYRDPGRPRQVICPAGLKMMYFPGFDNPWEREKLSGCEWIYDAWAYGTPPPTSSQHAALAARLRKRRDCLWAYDDPKGWGRSFHKAAREMRQRVRLFVRAERPPADARVFVRLDQSGKQRKISKTLALEIADRGCVTLPTREESVLYDDKVRQLDVLRRWMPTTFVLREAKKALAVASAARAGLGLSYPFVSKAAEGAASANVRLVRTPGEAAAEVKAVFGGTGLPRSYNTRQIGYLYWQRLVENQDSDWRICVVGPYWYGLRRYVRPGGFTASGSGNFKPIVGDDPRDFKAAELALEISRDIGTQWMAYDVVFEEDRPLVLEMSSAWTMKAYKDCPMFDYDLRSTTRTGSDSFRIAVDILRGTDDAPIDTRHRRPGQVENATR